MANGKLEIDTEINTDGVEKGLKNVQGKLNAIKSTGMAAVIAGEAKALKKLTAEIKATADAYNGQIKAEKQLETAAKNNPYLDNNSVKALKDYASQLQSISTVGDEQLLPLMAQLASAGRTQEEIQKIMSAALDVSASGAMSLEGAVKNLNKSFSGLSGELGESVPAIKELSAEELKNGAAVDVLAKQYKGMAEEVANASGSYEQMKNAQGDFNEAVGKITKPASDLWNKFWKGWYERGIENINKIETWFDARTIGKKLATQISDGLSDLNKLGDQKGAMKFLRDSLNAITDDELTSVTNYLNTLARVTPEQQQIINRLDAEKERRQFLADTTAKQKKAIEEQNEVEDKRKEFIEKNQAALDHEIEVMKLKAELSGEEIDAQDLLNTYMASYIDLVTGGVIDENDPFSQERLRELQAFARGLDTVTDSAEKLAETEKELVDFQKIISDLNSYLSEYSQITNNAVGLFTEGIQAEAEIQQNELAKQYTDGLIGYEEYNEKKKEIDKKAAQEEYKLKMWEWSSSLLTATANIAEGVSKAIAQGGVAGIITGALVAASGAIQIATITANKPKPAFATGGIVGGNSYTGDHISARVNSGEMILNASQQARLWNMANGKGGGGSVVNMPVTIVNNSSTHVSTQMNKNGLRVIVDEMVGSSMAEGRYNEQMAIGQSKAAGVQIY